MSMTGRFVWYELMTPDPKAAEAFYTQVIGWTAADANMPNGDYTLFSAGGPPVAGLMAMPPEAAANGAKPGWRGFVAVDDTDAKAKELQQAGGALHYGPEDIPGVGRFASVTDAQGVPFMLFTPQPGSDGAPPAMGAPGTVGWNELAAVDGPAAFTFYESLFGWTKAEAHDMGPMGVYQTFATGGQPVGGMMTRPYPNMTPQWLYYVNVDSAGAAIDRIKKAGGQVTMGPQVVPGGSFIVQGQDPQGVAFAVVSMKE